MGKRDDTPRRRGMGGAAKAGGVGSGRMFHVKHSSSRKPGTGRREGGLRGGARRRAERGIGRVERRGEWGAGGTRAGRGRRNRDAGETWPGRGAGRGGAEAQEKRGSGRGDASRTAKVSRMRVFYVKHARGARCGRDAEAQADARRSDALPGNDTPPGGAARPRDPTPERVPRLPPVRAVSSIGQRGSTQKLATYECFT